MTAGLSVLVLAAGAPWEPGLLAALRADRVAVQRRCVDVADLMAAADTRLSTVAIVDGGTPGMDAEVARWTRERGVRLVLVGGAPEDRERWRRLGIAAQSGDSPEAILAAAKQVAASSASAPDAALPDGQAAGGPDEGPDEGAGADLGHPVVAIWGPPGAPGRTTLVLALARMAAVQGGRVTAVDADPAGGTAGIYAGLAEETAGLLLAARAWNTGRLDAATLRGFCRDVAGVDLLTGLPRGERRVEVRPGAVAGVLGVAASGSPVVVDAGSGSEADARDRMSVEALTSATSVVVVGSADPVGAVRLARSLEALAEVAPAHRPWVVVNRVRPRLGWGAAELGAVIEGRADLRAITELPEDPALDRAHLVGRLPGELGASPYTHAVARLGAELWPGRGGASAPTTPGPRGDGGGPAGFSRGRRRRIGRRSASR